MPSKLLLEVADYCWSKNFLDVFRNFFTEHAEAFEGSPPMLGGEHNLEYYDLFQVYLKLYETTLMEYLNTIDCEIEQFYKEVRAAQNEVTEPYIATFIDCLLASTDYESFYKVMAREGSKSAARRAALNIAADSKAESKTSSSPIGRSSPGKYPAARADSKYDDYDDGDKKSYK
mmetsp:Transcript_18398/g.26522  ORF Transcript_18398/g.26522 Transcript_18398/m.26522 type:complete len:174 (+) Transcript_18398:166-687(+)